MLRRYVAEFIGTFFLVFLGTGMRAMVGGETHDFAGILLVHLVFACTILAMASCLGHISAAHLNPAITLGFAFSRRFPWRYVLPYWLAQCLGAIMASATQELLFPDKAAFAHFGATTPKIALPAALGVEFLLTFLLMFISMAVATDTRVNQSVSGVVVGLTVLACGLFGNSLTGGSMNPARSLGPALFAGGNALSSYWIYLVAPVLGALLAAAVYEFIRGSEASIKGAPQQLLPDRHPTSSEPSSVATSRR